MSAPTPDFALAYRDLMINGFAREIEITKKVLAAIPEDKRDYRPDPNARTAWDLAWHIANTDVQFLNGIADLKFTMANPAEADKPKTIAEIVAWYDTNAKRALDRRTVAHPGSVFHVQSARRFLFGIRQQSQHSPSRRVGDLSPPHGVESSLDLWRQFRRAHSRRGVSRRALATT